MLATSLSEGVFWIIVSVVVNFLVIVVGGMLLTRYLKRRDKRRDENQEAQTQLAAARVAKVAEAAAERLFDQVKPGNGSTLGQVADKTHLAIQRLELGQQRLELEVSKGNFDAKETREISSRTADALETHELASEEWRRTVIDRIEGHERRGSKPQDRRRSDKAGGRVAKDG